jgi:TnpA family transposase
VSEKLFEENWLEILRLAASVRAGTVAPSALLKRLAAYPRQNTLAKALLIIVMLVSGRRDDDRQRA